MTDERPTPIEDRLRAALTDRAARIEPSTDGLDRIEEKLMSPTRTFSSTQKWILGVASAAAVVLLVVVGLVIAGDDEDTPVVADTSEPEETTTSEATTTTTEETTTTAAFPPDVDPYGVAYPSPTTSQRFDSPDAAAQSYATQVLGFTELVVGEFLEGDSRSGEIEITDREGNPATTLLLRQMDDDHWYVLGSQATDVTVDRPFAGDSISSPFETSGSALAFEGTVDVVVQAQDDPMPLGEGFVTGGGTPPGASFEGTIEFTQPAEETPGILIYRTMSPEDGHVMQATSFPVRLRAA